MRSRAARLTLVILFVAALGVTAYLFWRGESLTRDDAAAAHAFARTAQAISRALLEVKGAQQAYVAAGHGGEGWSKRVSEGLASARSGLVRLVDSVQSQQARSELEAASAALQDFAQLDKKIASFARGGQLLMAADLIFDDSDDLLDSALASVEKARTEETAASYASADTFRRRQIFALAAAAAAALLVVLLLAPLPPAERTLASLARTADPPLLRAGASGTNSLELDEGWSPPRPAALDSPAASEPTSAVPEDSPPTQDVTLPRARDPQPSDLRAEGSSPDFADLARLCTDFACVADTRALPGLLDRAAGLLDASGIILWIADPDGRELNPIVAQGYPPQLLNRLGTIPRQAENATAAAFRTALLQTVNGDSESDGAIAAPLLAPTGCVGVMAAEVRHARERQQETLAAATIVAAQLATLVGPTSSKQSTVASR